MSSEKYDFYELSKKYGITFQRLINLHERIYDKDNFEKAIRMYLKGQIPDQILKFRVNDLRRAYLGEILRNRAGKKPHVADFTIGMHTKWVEAPVASNQKKSIYRPINCQDLKLFTDRGIPILPMLSGFLSELEGRVVSIGEVTDRVSNGRITKRMIEKSFYSLSLSANSILEQIKDETV